MSGSWMRRFGQGFKLENEIKGKSMIGIYIYIYIYYFLSSNVLWDLDLNPYASWDLIRVVKPKGFNQEKIILGGHLTGGIVCCLKLLITNTAWHINHSTQIATELASNFQNKCTVHTMSKYMKHTMSCNIIHVI